MAPELQSSSSPGPPKRRCHGGKSKCLQLWNCSSRTLGGCVGGGPTMGVISETLPDEEDLPPHSELLAAHQYSAQRRYTSYPPRRSLGWWGRLARRKNLVVLNGPYWRRLPLEAEAPLGYRRTRELGMPKAKTLRNPTHITHLATISHRPP